MRNKIDFIEDDTKHCLLIMAVPMLAVMILTMAYNLVDSLWIGNLLGETAYAALTSSMPILLILASVAMGATNGISILVSQAIGSKNRQHVDQLIATSFVMSILCAILITILLEVALPFILQAMGTPKETYEMAHDYLAVYIIGFVAMYLYMYFTAVLRSFGNATFQAIAMLICTILNAILDPIFIKWLHFHGAAIATVLSQVVCVLVMSCYLKKKKLFQIQLASFHTANILPIIQKAVPSIIQQSIPSISTTCITTLISSYSISVIAAFGIAGRLESILFFPAMALNMVLTTIIGQCTGGKRLDRARVYIKYALWFGCLFILVLSGLTIVFSDKLTGLFIRNVEVAQIVKHYFMIISIGYVLNCVTNCFLGVINGLGKPSYSMLLMILYYLIIRIPMAYVFSVGCKAGLDGIWTAVLVSHIIACIAAITCAVIQFRRVEGRLNKKAIIA